MNFVFISPHFPPNYYPFSIHLSSMGVEVLGIADDPFEVIRPELKSYLTEYYWVEDLHKYDALLRACGYFTHKYGKIDRLDSHNEYWLTAEANLRTDFNIPGLKIQDMPRIKRKSLMKEVYRSAGVRVAHGRVINKLTDAQELIREIGYPVVAKPDIGVGAVATYKINNSTELEDFISSKPPVDYIIEEFKKDSGIDIHNDAMAMQRLRETAEKAKIELSSTITTDINLPFITADQTGPKHLVMNITRAKLEELVRPLVEKTRHSVEQALSDAKLQPADIHRIIMVGGPTRMPLVQQFVEDV